MIERRQVLLDIRLRIYCCWSVHDRKAHKRICESTWMHFWQVARRYNAHVHFCGLHRCFAAALIPEAPRPDNLECARGPNNIAALNQLYQIAFVRLDAIHSDHLRLLQR
jgi:hypothetical protein